MGKDYKKLAQKIRSQQEQKKQEVNTSLIPPQLALLGNVHEFVGESKFRLNFALYKHELCELRKFSNFQPLIKKLDFITRNDKDNFRNRGSITNAGNYKDLYRGLSSDITLEEIGLGDSSRIIFFRVENYFCLRAVLFSHR